MLSAIYTGTEVSRQHQSLIKDASISCSTGKRCCNETHIYPCQPKEVSYHYEFVSQFENKSAIKPIPVNSRQDSSSPT